MLSQSFGDAVASNEADLLTAVEFDSSGQYFATGDRGGRIVVFKCTGMRAPSPHLNRSNNLAVSSSSSPSSKSSSPILQNHQPLSPTARSNNKMSRTWCPHFQFQSHDPDFDYLKSVEIEEKINQIKFLPPVNDKLFILSTNDKTVKLWKVSEGFEYHSSAADTLATHQQQSMNGNDIGNCSPTTSSSSNIKSSLSPSSSISCSLPLPQRTQPTTYANIRRTYQNAHAYNINSVSLNSDGESFISCDDLRINCWKYDYPDTCFTLVDVKPQLMKELTEVITAARMHPKHCHTLAYSTSRGVIKVVDTRQSCLCDTPASIMTDPTTDDPQSQLEGALANLGVADSAKAYYAEIISNISDINYDQSGRYMVSRDYLSVKIWDTHMTSAPLLRIPVQDHLAPFLSDLMEADSIFDKFTVCFSPDGNKVLTGSYSNQFGIYHTLTGEKIHALQLAVSPTSVFKRPGMASPPPMFDPEGRLKEIRIPKGRIKGVNEIRADQKILYCAWHPTDAQIAIGGQAGMYIYRV